MFYFGKFGFSAEAEGVRLSRGRWVKRLPMFGQLCSSL
jgi:hypothetical protein